MTINLLDIKPGTLLIYKHHSLIKELFYKLLKKETSFNRIEIVPEECTISQFEGIDDMLILNPKRLYSRAEIKTLKNYLEDNCIDAGKVSTVIKAINIILEIMKEFMVHVQEVLLFYQNNLLMLKEKEQTHAQKVIEHNLMILYLIMVLILKNNKYGHY